MIMECAGGLLVEVWEEKGRGAGLRAFVPADLHVAIVPPLGGLLHFPAKPMMLSQSVETQDKESDCQEQKA
jgi:hypothetical protein